MGALPGYCYGEWGRAFGVLSGFVGVIGIVDGVLEDVHRVWGGGRG